MIKIIKNSPKEFIAECDKCRCQFSYELEDLHNWVSMSFVICPHCGHQILHNIKEKEDSYDN